MGGKCVAVKYIALALTCVAWVMLCQLRPNKRCFGQQKFENNKLTICSQQVQTSKANKKEDTLLCCQPKVWQVLLVCSDMWLSGRGQTWPLSDIVLLTIAAHCMYYKGSGCKGGLLVWGNHWTFGKVVHQDYDSFKKILNTVWTKLRNFLSQDSTQMRT